MEDSFLPADHFFVSGRLLDNIFGEKSSSNGIE